MEKIMRSSNNPPALQPGFDFVPPASPAERRYRINRELATDEAGLMEQARAWLKEYDTAIRSGEEERAENFRERLAAIADKLPEDEDDETARERLGRMLAAAPGQVPLWGQTGGFLITVKGCRIVVRTAGDFQLEFTAFDWEKPFFSKIGYFSLYAHDDLARGRTVKQCAIWLLQHRDRDKMRLVPIEHNEWVDGKKTTVTPGPDKEDRDWQPGGWIYELKQRKEIP
jgi:hypothetical protein